MKEKNKNNKIPSRLSWNQLVFPSSQCQLNGHTSNFFFHVCVPYPLPQLIQLGNEALINIDHFKKSTNSSTGHWNSKKVCIQWNVWRNNFFILLKFISRQFYILSNFFYTNWSLLLLVLVLKWNKTSYTEYFLPRFLLVFSSY